MKYQKPETREKSTERQEQLSGELIEESRVNPESCKDMRSEYSQVIDELKGKV